MASSLRSLAVTACRTSTPRVTIAGSSCASGVTVVSLSKRQLSLVAAPRQRGPKFVQRTTRGFHTSTPSQSIPPQSTPKFTYGIAASFSAKDHKYNPNRNIFNFDPYNHIRARRKNKKTRPGSGQDAFFVSRVGETSDVAFGVADGVGGWMNSGVDPADFSHGLCDYAAHAAYTHRPEEWETPLNARSLMQRGYEDICNDETVRAGGSTACVAIARGTGQLEVANLGDSGFVQLRLNAVHDYSEPQTHAFNTPYQLSIVPKKILAQVAAFGGTQLCDFPKDANVSQHALRHGDVLVFATDGVWDNLSRHEILKIVSKIMIGANAWVHTENGIGVGTDLHNFTMPDDGKDATEDIPSLQSFLAVGITNEAKAASMNTKLDGPFAREVQREFPYEKWQGGKVDDICVVVAIACEEKK
ncbi:Protein serine phosphatase 2C [Venustampulla echinocandica]|uniref:Protein phosphatase n=1 Tax=Venustampulla echinocandica TaxID=2656787 RepID=A0A370TS23_9HELO|nr:Protein serine phosphatase 2C [Venustampulla echinocandica]RDL38314.1 Protein serine phosphatase 2C [Venustampulla echinocandica]